MKRPGETQRQREYRHLRQAEIRTKLETADRLREEGHPEAADDIELALGLKKPDSVDPKVEEATRLLRDHRPQQLYESVKAGTFTEEQLYRLQQVLTPEEQEVYEQVLELTKPEDTVGPGVSS